MKNSPNNYLFHYLLAFALLLPGCTGTLLLPKGERLYTGAKVKVQPAGKNWKTTRLEEALPQAVVLPRPNRHLLWIRTGVAIYNAFHRPNKEKGFGNWVAEKLGTPPVRYSDDIRAAHQKALIAVAADYGFFEVNIESKAKGFWKKKKLKHTVHLLKPAKTLQALRFPPDTGAVERRLLQLSTSTLLKPGSPYRFETLTAERQRLADSLRNEGWFYLSPDHLLFEADTLQASGEVLLSLRFKDDVTAMEKRRYRIGEIFIYPDYDLKIAGKQGQQMEATDDCTAFVFSEESVKKQAILDNIRFHCGEYFSNENYRTTLFRLLNLQFFKFVNIRFEPSLLADSLLEVQVLLTPAVPQKVEASLSAIYSPNNYVGLQTGLTWQHRNIFGAAENLRIAWEGSLLRFGNDQSTLLASDTKAQLTLPQKIPGLRSRQKNALTATRFSLSHELLSFIFPIEESKKLTLAFHRLQGEGGFTWKKNRQGTITHELNPFNAALQFIHLSEPGLKELLLSEISTDTTGEALFYATFVELRPNYAFIYDNRLGETRKWQTFFRQKFTLRGSGFLLPDFIAAATNLGYPVHFFTESDLRQYLLLSRKTTLAWRISWLAGLPLSETRTFGFLDLYTIGGASSVRAFSPRSIGPGAAQTPDSTATDAALGLATHTGNLQLLGSLELRQRIGKSWEWATFLDAGNVWLTDADPEQPAGEFSGKRFYRELASGAGMGLRFNLGFFVLRLDLAIPLSKPFKPEGSRFIGQRGFGRASIRGNFAFGYPF